MSKNREGSESTNKTISIEIKIGENTTELLEVDSNLWVKLENTAQDHGNAIGEELEEILTQSDGKQ